jgi:5,10-methylene-tetrahydrofolate dehydrogenase/methenyl tetrahydrofolate cyclohydrolase
MKLNVKEYVTRNKEILKKEIAESGLKPKLTIIKNNDDPRSDAYVRNKIKDCKEVGKFFKEWKFVDSILNVSLGILI